jgi:hypothetical protein
VGGKCTNKSARCGDDGVSKIDPDGTVSSCLPFACEAGACVTQCGSSEDCAPGNVCSEAKLCVGAGGGTSSSGCCDAGGGVSTNGAGAVLALLGGVALLGRRRRGVASRSGR